MIEYPFLLDELPMATNALLADMKSRFAVGDDSLGALRLSVEFLHSADRIEDKPIWPRRQDFADVFLWRETIQRLPPLGERLGCEEGGEF